MEKPKILSSKTLFKGFFDVQQDLIQRADGKELPYSHCVLPTDAAVVIGETSDGHFILNREYRHPTGEYILGCPGGGLHEKEDPILGGLREFHEESGYWSDSMELLGISYPLAAICNQKIYFLWAKNAYLKGEQALDLFEYIHTELKTEEELDRELRSGSVLDGLLLTALTFRRLRVSRSIYNTPLS
jgi:ADP-ribose pyrophosphatase